MADGWLIDARDKPALLRSLMQALAGGAHIALEGDLDGFDVVGLSAVDESHSSLRRQTQSPQLDLLILPLTQENEPAIWRALSRMDRLIDRLIHVQIEKDGRLAFAACDNFHEDCVFASAAVPFSLLEDLRERGVIRSFGPAKR